MEFFKSGFPKDLTADFSPSLPKGFPQDRIPKNICEVEFLALNRCLYLQGVQMQCQNQYKEFLDCKKDRDLKLFEKIRQWEKEYFGELVKPMRSMYLNGLNSKLERLKNELETLPPSFFYVNKRQRHQADIDQLQWRLMYLKKVV